MIFYLWIGMMVMFVWSCVGCYYVYRSTFLNIKFKNLIPKKPKAKATDKGKKKLDRLCDDSIEVMEPDLLDGSGLQNKSNDVR